MSRPFAMSTLSEIALAAERLAICEGRFTSLAPRRDVINVKFDARLGRRAGPARAAGVGLRPLPRVLTSGWRTSVTVSEQTAAWR
jgi:hypothetical protein